MRRRAFTTSPEPRCALQESAKIVLLFCSIIFTSSPCQRSVLNVCFFISMPRSLPPSAVPRRCDPARAPPQLASYPSRCTPKAREFRPSIRRTWPRPRLTRGSPQLRQRPSSVRAADRPPAPLPPTPTGHSIANLDSTCNSTPAGFITKHPHVHRAKPQLPAVHAESCLCYASCVVSDL